MVAGVFMNLVAAMIIYAGILFAWGEDYLRNENVVHGYAFSEPAKELGFEDRDRILSIDNEAIGNAEEIGMKLLLSEADRNVTVLRNRDTVTFTISMERLIAMREAREFAGMYTPIQLPYVVDSCSNEAVAALGYREGDQIVAVDDVAACSGEVIRPMLAERKGRVANVRVLRYETDSVTLAERPVYVEIATPINEEGMIGIMLKEQPAVEFTHVDYTFWESIPAGVKSGIREVKSYWDQLVMMVNPDTKLYKEVGGFLSIGSVFPDTWNWLAFWNITALISIMLAVMNLLPIPVLDGGHVLFALYEIITRRKPNEKFLEVAQTIGFMLLMLLLIYANGNDIMNLFK
jgi:regulator of sigma E protease